MRFHWQNLNERPRSRVGDRWQRAPTGLPVEGRAWWHFGTEDEEHTRLHVEWHLRSTCCGIGLDIQPFGDDNVLFHTALPPVDLYLGASGQRLGKWLQQKMGTSCDSSRRTISLRIFDWAIWWQLWVDSFGWSKKRPRWREGNVHILDTLFGKRVHSERLLVTREITICMPEGYYKGTCELSEGTWKRPRAPLPLRVVRARVKMNEPIPIPGKGENSWDIEDTAIHSSSFKCSSVAEAIGKLTADVLHTRERYGGVNWQPKDHSPPSTA